MLHIFVLTMKMVILLFVYLSSVIALVSGVPAVGDHCEQEDGREGNCCLIYDCISAMSDIEYGIKPKLCGFDDKVPIVCCTERLKRVKKSDEMCFEYAKMTLQSRIHFKDLDFNQDRFFFGSARSLSREFPHMAALGYGEKEDPKWNCGGSLISDKYVLTAAHCLTSRELGDVKWVRLGDLNLYTSVDDARPEDFEIAKRIKHPGYFPPERYNDLGIIKLNGTVEFNNYIYPACLNRIYNISSETLTATGWGLTETLGNPSDHLIKADLDVFTDEECKQMYRPERTLKKGVLSDSQFCAGGRTTERGTCSGDSGGPIQIKMDNIRNLYSVVGITSFGRGGCGVKASAGVYTRVSRYTHWIESIVWDDSI